MLFFRLQSRIDLCFLVEKVRESVLVIGSSGSLVLLGILVLLAILLPLSSSIIFHSLALLALPLLRVGIRVLLVFFLNNVYDFLAFDSKAPRGNPASAITGCTTLSRRSFSITSIFGGISYPFATHEIDAIDQES